MTARKEEAVSDIESKAGLKADNDGKAGHDSRRKEGRGNKKGVKEVSLDLGRDSTYVRPFSGVDVDNEVEQCAGQGIEQGIEYEMEMRMSNADRWLGQWGRRYR